MNKIRFTHWILIGLLLVLTACQAAGQPLTATMSKPGDAINGLSLATGAADAPPLWAFCSGSQGSSHLQTFHCQAPVLPTLAIGHVFLLADEALVSLDWSQFVWELSIDDQPVDLESFGTFDYVMPGMAKSPSPVREVFQKATAWNIVLTNLNPGEHTIRFLAQNETDSYSWLVNLVIGPEEGADISAVPFPLHS